MGYWQFLKLYDYMTSGKVIIFKNTQPCNIGAYLGALA